MTTTAEQATGSAHADAVADPVAATDAPNAAEVAALVRRLRRVEGQVGGLVRMLEAGRDCADVVTQLAAASRALDRVGFLLVAGELRTCMSGQVDGSPDGEAALKVAALEKLFLTLA